MPQKGTLGTNVPFKGIERLREVEEEQPYFLGEVGTENKQDDWTVSLLINNMPITFKIDTGADATVIDQETFKLMSPKIVPGTPKTRFISPGGNLDCIGCFETTTSYKGRQYAFPVYVMREACNCLLGLPEAVRMGPVKRVDQVSNIIGSSGLLKTEPVKITPQEGAQPYAVHAARRTPLPLDPLSSKSKPPSQCRHPHTPLSLKPVDYKIQSSRDRKETLAPN